LSSPPVRVPALPRASWWAIARSPFCLRFDARELAVARGLPLGRFVTSSGSPRLRDAHSVPPLHVCPFGLLTIRRVLREGGVRSSHSSAASPCRSRSPWVGCVVREVAPVVFRPPVGPWAGCSLGLLPKQVTSGDVAFSLRGLLARRVLLRVPGESPSPCGVGHPHLSVVPLAGAIGGGALGFKALLH